MIIAGTNRNVETHIPGEVNNAMIKTNAKAFQVLSSNLYTNKPLAIVRELSANALDAHLAAGNTQPFEIAMPTTFRPELHVKDYGTGLDHQSILDLYMTYFGSNKSDSNMLTGGLGLGSKTPFAYVDTFTVISRFKGKRSTYTAFKDEDGMPKIVLLDMVDTVEHNGLEVIVPVKRQDMRAFIEIAQRALAYFPSDMYTITGAVIRVPEYELKNDMFGVRKPDGNGPNIVMGPIAYPLDWSSIPSKERLKFGILEHRAANFDIFCDIGELDIQASREALSYDKRSITQLLKRLTQVQETFLEEVCTSIEQMSSVLERAHKAGSVLRQWGLAAQDAPDLNKYILAATYKHVEHFLGTPTSWHTQNPKIEWDDHLGPFGIQKDTIFIFIDEKAGKAPPLNKFLRENRAYLEHKNICFVKGEVHKAAVQRICGDKNWVDFSDIYIKVPPVPRKVANKKAAGDVLRRNVFNGGIIPTSRYQWDDFHVEDVAKLDPKKYVYMLTTNFTFEGVPARAFRLAEGFGLLKGIEILGVPRAEKHLDEMFKKHLKTLDVVLFEKIKEAYNDPDFQLRMRKQHLWNTLLSDDLRTLFRANRDFFQVINNAFPTSPLAAATAGFYKMAEDVENHKTYADFEALFAAYPGEFKTMHTATKDDTKFFALWRLCLMKYPMLEALVKTEQRWGGRLPIKAETFKHYMAAVENT